MEHAAEQSGGLHIALEAETLFTVFGFPVTNTLLVTWMASLILIGIALAFWKRRQEIPGRFQAALELFFVGMLSLMDSITGDRKKTERFAPVVFTIFLFVLVANWMELLPGFESITVDVGDKQAPLLRSPSSDLNMTFALALIAVGATQFFGARVLGIGAHLKKYFTFKQFPLGTFVGLLEFVSEFTKVLSFAFRLFGNIFAGGVLLLVVSFLIPFIAPLPFLGIEIFVGLVQALVFSILSLVFITMATESAH